MTASLFSLGTEVLSGLQIVFFLALGYTVTRVWLWWRTHFAEARVKKLECDLFPEDEEESQVQQKASRKQQTKSTTTLRAHHSDVEAPKVSQPRRRQRKAAPKAGDTERLAPLELEQPSEPTAPAQPEPISASPTTPNEVKQAAQPPKRRGGKRNGAKGGAKGQKLASAESPEGTSHDGPDGQELLCGVACTPQPAGAQAKIEAAIEIEEESPATLDSVNVLDIEAEASPTAMDADVEEVADGSSAPDCTNAQEEPVEHCIIVSDMNSAADGPGLPEESQERLVEASTEEEAEGAVENTSDDDTGSDWPTVPVASTPDVTPRHSSPPQQLWCPSAMPEAAGLPQTVDRWIPVAVPLVDAEGKPVPGMPLIQLQEPLPDTGSYLDGVWQNLEGEVITIEGVGARFDTGAMWTMQLNSPDEAPGCSVELDGQMFHAELSMNGQELHWNDGDVWACIGSPTQQPWCGAVQEADQPPEGPWMEDPSQCMVWPQEQFALPCGEDPLCPPGPFADSEKPRPKYWKDDAQWEVCWDWRKGRCPRGAACEWRHPEPTNKLINEDAPFADENLYA